MNKRTPILKEGEIIPISFDYVFTNIFNNQYNINILESFIACYLDIPVEEIKGNIELLNRNLVLEEKITANKQVDLIVNLKGEKINIELSNRVDQGIIDRNIVYACNIHSRQLLHGTRNYNEIKKTIQINLNNKTGDDLKKTYYLKSEKDEVLTKKFQIDVINMVKGRELCYTKDETKLARWCSVILAKTKEEFERALGDDLMEKEVKGKLETEVNKYSEDNETIALYTELSRTELEQNTFIDTARKEGIEQGLEQGKEIGINQRNIEIAKNLLEQNIDINVIEEATGLSKEQLEELK